MIKAAVVRKARRRFKIEPVETSSLAPKDVLIRLVASGVCRTDIDLWESASGTDLPFILGHEGAGIVERAGKSVKTLRAGDHVVLSYQSCGRCSCCRRGQPFNCSRFFEVNFGFARLDGSSAYSSSGVRGHFFGQSSFATHSIASERNCVRVAKSLPLHVLAPLGCGVQTGAGTILNSLSVKPRHSLIVFGTGAVGLSAVMAAKIAGASPIIAVDREPKRLRLACQLGAHAVIDGTGARDLGKQLRELTGGGADYALDTTPSSRVRQLALQALGPKGMLAIVSGEPVPKHGRVISVIQGDSDPKRFIPFLISEYRKGRFPFDRMLRFYKFSDINKAVEDIRRGRAIKAVLRMPVE